jgi:Bacterial regulatory proteins, luxR family
MGTETLDELETLGHYCDADILRLKAEGLSNRQVAREIGVDEKTVRNKGAEKLQNGEIPHPPPRPEWAQKLDELETLGRFDRVPPRRTIDGIVGWGKTA